MGKHFDVQKNAGPGGPKKEHHYYYYMYAIERMGMLTGYYRFGKND